MASPMFHFVLGSLRNSKIKCLQSHNIIRYTSKSPKPKNKPGTIKHRNLIKSSCESLAARGFLRSQKPYTPSENVTEKIAEICQEVLGASYSADSTLSREDKFALLTTCFKKFDYSVPNSRLHQILTVNDVINFYLTPVSTTVPYDEFQNQDLPPNLHIQQDYHRFDPETDTKFKGISAFPRSSTIVTGLKYKEKYKGYKAPSPYLDYEAVYNKTHKFD